MNPGFRLPPYEATPVAASALSEVMDWSISFLGIPELWKKSEGEGVVVAVLDTGCDLSHPDLAGAILDAADFTGSLFGPNDRQGHGTWCAGMIGARANDIGVRGIAPKAMLLSGKVLGDDGSGSEQSILRGIKWADSKGAHIISMSLGGPSMSETLHDAIRAFVAKPHRFVVCAAGNEGRVDSVNFPAKWDEAIAVAAVDETGTLTKFSSRGKEVDIAAPGANMLSTVPMPAAYAKMSGTSMACPVVAGIAAACLSKHLLAGNQATGLESYRDLQAHLRKTAKDAGPVGQDTGYGWGIIDPKKLFEAANPLTPPVTPTPEGPTGVMLVVPDHAGQLWQSEKISWKRVA